MSEFLYQTPEVSISNRVMRFFGPGSLVDYIGYQPKGDRLTVNLTEGFGDPIDLDSENNPNFGVCNMPIGDPYGYGVGLSSVRFRATNKEGDTIFTVERNKGPDLSPQTLTAFSSSQTQFVDYERGVRFNNIPGVLETWRPGAFCSIVGGNFVALTSYPFDSSRALVFHGSVEREGISVSSSVVKPSLPISETDPSDYVVVNEGGNNPTFGLNDRIGDVEFQSDARIVKERGATRITATFGNREKSLTEELVYGGNVTFNGRPVSEDHLMDNWEVRAGRIPGFNALKVDITPGARWEAAKIFFGDENTKEIGGTFNFGTIKNIANVIKNLQKSPRKTERRIEKINAHRGNPMVTVIEDLNTTEGRLSLGAIVITRANTYSGKTRLEVSDSIENPFNFTLIG